MRNSAPLPLLLAVLLLIVSSRIELVSAQTCATLTSNTCSDIIPVGTRVFVPPDTTLDVMEYFTSSLLNVVNYYAYPEPCRSYAFQLICGSWFRPCLVVNNETLPIPQEPCLNMCETYYNACVVEYPFVGPSAFAVGLGLYFPVGKAPVNCSAPPVDIWAGNVTFYPASDTIVTYQNVNYTVPCSQAIPIIPPAPTYCEAPLELAISPNGGPQCAFSCPLPSLSDSEYENVKILQGIMGWMSWVASAALFLVLVFNPKSRAFPRILVIMVAAAANIAAGAIILPTYAGYENIWCGGGKILAPQGTIVGADQYALPIIDWHTDESFLDVESSACTFQGAMLQFGFLAAVFWWVIIAFNMTLELYLGQLVPLQRGIWKWVRFGIYALIGWGIPFILMVIPAAAGRIKFVASGTYCFITNEDNYAWSLTFWFIPVGTSLLLGVALFFAASIRLIWLLVKLKKTKMLIALNVRLLLFILLYLTLFVFIAAYNIQVADNQSSINQGYNDYYTCLIFGKSGCSLSDSVSNYNLVMLKAFAISALGTLLFPLFISWDIIRFWYRLFAAVGVAAWTKNPQGFNSVFSLLAHETTRSGTTGGTNGALSLSIVGEEPPEPNDGKTEDDEVSSVADSKEVDENSSSSE